eukprot:5828710-Pyramimonas_sp.AAC.1
MRGLIPDIKASDAKLDHMEANMSAQLGAMKASAGVQEQHLQHLHGRVNGLEQAQQGAVTEAAHQAASVAMGQKMHNIQNQLDLFSVEPGGAKEKVENVEKRAQQMGQPTNRRGGGGGGADTA